MIKPLNASVAATDAKDTPTYVGCVAHDFSIFATVRVNKVAVSLARLVLTTTFTNPIAETSSTPAIATAIDSSTMV